MGNRNSPAASTTTTANSGRHPIQSYCHDSRALARPLNHNTFPWSFAPLRQQVLPPTANYMQMNWPNWQKRSCGCRSAKKKKNATTRKVEKRKQQIANCGPVLAAEGEWIHQGRRRKINVCRRYRYSYSTVELMLSSAWQVCWVFEQYKNKILKTKILSRKLELNLDWRNLGKILFTIVLLFIIYSIFSEIMTVKIC